MCPSTSESHRHSKILLQAPLSSRARVDVGASSTPNIGLSPMYMLLLSRSLFLNLHPFARARRRGRVGEVPFNFCRDLDVNSGLRRDLVCRNLRFQVQSAAFI